MPRIACGVEYRGTAYGGWQRQQALNVQGHVERALAKVADHAIEIVCAGRTDRGVHGLGQVIHFDSQAKREMRSWVLGANTHLPADIRLVWAQNVPDHFHARFTAIARRYQYVLFNGLSDSAVFCDHVAWHYKTLNADSMHLAAQQLLGEHDFTSFRGADCQAKSASRCIEHFVIRRYGDFIVFDVKANAFLYHMVRNMVGSLLQVGEGVRPIAWIKEVLTAKNRCQAGITAAAAGLYFVQAYYGTPYKFPEAKPLFFLMKNTL